MQLSKETIKINKKILKESQSRSFNFIVKKLNNKNDYY